MKRKITPIFECFELGIKQVGKKLGFAFAVVMLQLVSLVGFASPGGNDPVHSNGGSTRDSILQSTTPFARIISDFTTPEFHEIVLEITVPLGKRIVGGYLNLQFEDPLRAGLLVTQHFPSANARMMGPGYQYITGASEDGSSDGVIRINLEMLPAPDGVGNQGIVRIRIEDPNGDGDLGTLRSMDGVGLTDVLIIAPIIGPLDDGPVRVTASNPSVFGMSEVAENDGYKSSLNDGTVESGNPAGRIGLASAQGDDGIALVANPVSESCRLRNDSQEAQNIAVVNAFGAVQMFVTVLPNSTRTVDVAHLAPGVYLLVDPTGKNLPFRMMVCR